MRSEAGDMDVLVHDIESHRTEGEKRCREKGWGQRPGVVHPSRDSKGI